MYNQQTKKLHLTTKINKQKKQEVRSHTCNNRSLEEFAFPAVFFGSPNVTLVQPPFLSFYFSADFMAFTNFFFLETLTSQHPTNLSQIFFLIQHKMSAVSEHFCFHGFSHRNDVEIGNYVIDLVIFQNWEPAGSVSYLSKCMIDL